ncbi:VOC family protein [Aestuariivirga sp.]|uniref:VOC family protein n=1 Tax=Aestuariivirga sp. TaxID=2650926 RepID=UPI003BA8A8BC
MRIDHIVFYSSDLAQARSDFSRSMDQEPLYGGEHPGEGTANALLGLGPATYLEILGRDVAQPEHALDEDVRALGGSGIYHWAAGGVDLEALAARAAKAGLEGGARVPGGRVKPDGTRLDWVCWGLRNHRFGSLIPFFIDWRGAEHPAQSVPRGASLASFEVHSPEADVLRGIFQTLGLDVPVIESDTPQVVAQLESAKGVTTLTSFSPLPKGYVI